MPRKSLIFFLAILFATALGLSRAFSEEKYYSEMETFSAIIHRVFENYVSELDEEQKRTLFEGAYRGALMTLDPYCQYFNQSQSETFSADTEGEFGGLGIEISIQDGILTVISPIRGTPAYEAGILAGDMILRIDGESTERITLEQAVGVLRGKPGSEVILTVRHQGSPVDNEITVTRAVIHPAAVESEMLVPENGIGYMRINNFSAKVMEDMRKGIDTLQKEGLKALVLDVRQNPGGLLDKAVAMSDEFLADGVIVSVKGRLPEMTEVYRAKRGDTLESLPVAVLVDQGSASASEIVAGALRDRKRGLLIGSRTYGKGSVQKVFSLRNGESLKMTTARYYTPADKPIEDRVGIMPDIYVPMSQEHLLALRNQEREDKLRGRYELRNLIEEEEPAPAPGTEDLSKAPALPETEEHAMERRRGRILDYQLKAAVNALTWQLMAAGSAGPAE